jgi:hypothetical protein
MRGIFLTLMISQKDVLMTVATKENVWQMVNANVLSLISEHIVRMYNVRKIASKLFYENESGHGVCDFDSASCICNKGFTGPSCEYQTCPNNCSIYFIKNLDGNGICLQNG